MSPIPDLLRTAIDLKAALDNAAAYLTPIGICHTKASEWREDTGEEHDEEDSSPGEDAVAKQAMEDLYKLQSTITVLSGEIKDLPFGLTIAREGCEFDGDISAFASKPRAPAPETTERLRRWYEAGAVSGYGDVKTQETKVDPSVRDAREITANEFRVSPDLIARVQDLWSASFFPTKVRAEPYKIHLYGPGGKFKPHRDTPETDLVGTFLVGLGDTSLTAEHWHDGAFDIKIAGHWTRHAAHVGSWIAFYPDVDHAVRDIVSGYRAVIAFKIFRERLDTPEVPAEVTSRKTKAVLMRLQKPYGILLRHQYSAGTAELNGSDASLYAAAGETGGDVRLLPVLIRWTARRDDFEMYDGSSECSADVFPMTQTHVDTILAHIRAEAAKPTEKGEEEEEEEEEENLKLVVDLTGTDAEWISHHPPKSIPFYSPSFHTTSTVWKEDVEEAIEHTGNESRPHEEDSIYLSYAVVVVPKRGPKREAGEEQPVGEGEAVP